VIPANIQDRDCAANLIRKTRRLFPWIAKVFADGGYAGAKLSKPRSRTLSWLRRNRRLMAHYEAFAVIAEGFAKLAMICVMLKQLTEPKPASVT
jgi:hypothetical protein